MLDGPKVTADGIPSDHDGHEHGRPEHAFSERLDAPLGDARLARNLTTFQQSWKHNRSETMATVPFAELRDNLKARKSEVIAHLDEQVAAFQAAAERAGARAGSGLLASSADGDGRTHANRCSR